ncbi:MAG: hypothetical protein ACK40U_04620 [Fervidobacterium pennivorans]
MPRKARITTTEAGTENTIKLKKEGDFIKLIQEKAHRYTSSRITILNQFYHIESPFEEYIFDINPDDFTHLLTITYRPPTDEIPELEQLKDLEEWTEKELIYIMYANDVIYQRIKQGLKRLKNLTWKHGEKLKYFLVFEPHRTFFIHAHALINLPQTLREWDFKKLTKTLAKYFGTEPQGVDLKFIKGNRKQVMDYVTKYLSKNTRKRFETQKTEDTEITEVDRNFILTLLNRRILKSREIRAFKVRRGIFSKKAEATTEKTFSYLKHTNSRTVTDEVIQKWQEWKQDKTTEFTIFRLFYLNKQAILKAKEREREKRKERERKRKELAKHFEELIKEDLDITPQEDITPDDELFEFF